MQQGTGSSEEPGQEDTDDSQHGVVRGDEVHFPLSTQYPDNPTMNLLRGLKTL